MNGIHTNMFRVDGKIAVVTGAGSGLGQVFAKALALFGAKVICADIEAVCKVRFQLSVGLRAKARPLSPTLLKHHPLKRSTWLASAHGGLRYSDQQYRHRHAKGRGHDLKIGIV